MAANLYITEFEDLYVSQGRVGQMANAPELANQKVDFTAGVTSSAAFGAFTHLIRVHAEAICSIKIGAAPTATTGMCRLAANQTEYFGVTPGHILSVIANT